jgi:uncharacterized protein (DUF2141 family)
MTRLLFFIMCLNIVAVSAAQDLEVIIKNVSGEAGTLMVGLFDSEKTFLKKAVRSEKILAQTGSVRAVFKGVEQGVYAISVFHDVNGNGKLDTNFMGIPKEGFGFSNDAKAMFGPASFAKAKFKCPSAEPVNVTMKYY